MELLNWTMVKDGSRYLVYNHNKKPLEQGYRRNATSLFAVAYMVKKELNDRTS
jgi:hypothetical protein